MRYDRLTISQYANGNKILVRIKMRGFFKCFIGQHAIFVNIDSHKGEHAIVKFKGVGKGSLSKQALDFPSSQALS